ncbi:MAG TPA: toll/interleukin-1 receptor domain-containing protein [Pyrinomonadaceae bacterium]|nr:toll/interleukin-1 receptor domain-containing protein [Pyrinomonadaceae bacterium]
MEISEAQATARMVLIYSHADRRFLDHSQLIYFLEGLAREERFDFWWDKEMGHPLWDEEIQRRLNDADIVVCLVSQAFLNSEYVRHVEAPITYRRLINDDILVVPLMLDASTWERYDWLSPIHHFPTDGTYLRRRGNLGPLYLEIIEYIREWFRRTMQPAQSGAAPSYQDPQMIYTLRRLPEAKLSRHQVRVLARDSCERAREMVKDAALREKIIAEARAMKADDTPLNKEQLARLDRKYLAGRRRKPDPKFVRWVLRCARLHPQGRA